LAVLAFDKNTLVFTAESKKWDQLSFKKDAASLAFFTAEGFLFTLIETYSEDDCVIWDPLTRKKIKSLDLDWSTDSKIRFSEHGGYAAVWDGHNNIRIWNINTENIIATLMVPTVADRSIQREDVPRDYLIGDGPQAIDASSDLKTIIVYSTIAENIVYDEASKQGTYDIAHQLIDVFRISELLAGSKDELIGKQKR